LPRTSYLVGNDLTYYNAKHIESLQSIVVVVVFHYDVEYVMIKNY